MSKKYEGFKVGLEIHQQLDTHKLFCNCPSQLVDDEGVTLLRRLRPTQSELGEVDRAALEEAKRNLQFVYQATPTTCLVEADEEPPHETNPEALDIALEVALLFNCDPVEEVHFMRKIVIDGSNTAGFQRTALIATDGEIEVNGKRIGIPTICLEEDAARKVGEREGQVIYRLDRLGIPLVEIATTPDISSPEEAREVALYIGGLLRATRKVKRGIGTIREDLNVSVPGGARIEIKGVQELNMISTYVEREVERQRKLIEVRERLRERGVKDVKAEPVDLTHIFERTESKVIDNALKRGGKVLGIKLEGFAGLFKGALGPEFAGRVRVVNVKGVFHSDELPGYGISAEETERATKELGCGDADGFVLVAEREEKARMALHETLVRAREAIDGIPEETRDPLPDGRTLYSRPLPGKERMYPETDIPPITIDEKRIESIRAKLPEPLEKRIEKLSERYGIHPQQSKQLVDEGLDLEFERLAKKHDPKLVAKTFLNTFPELRREGVNVDTITLESLEEVFIALERGRFAKEALPDVISQLARGLSPEEGLRELKLVTISQEELRRIVADIVEERIGLVKERGLDAFGPLMGVVMEQVRGKADGKLVSMILREELQKRV